MKNRSTIAIFSEWQQLAFSQSGNLHAPSRETIQPRKLGRHLSDLFFLEENETGQLIFRLAGTRICTLFGRELKLTRFLTLWHERNRPALDEMARNVCELLIPALSHNDGISLSGRSLSFEMLLAPLSISKDGRMNLLGSISVLDDIAWAGADPIILGNINKIRPLAPDMLIAQEEHKPSATKITAINDRQNWSAPIFTRDLPQLRVINGGKA
ncbi:PAS domain-containing protein [Brucella gallinifaecis]|uniref:PAS domain-containing protein n=1 Tax=Brucella gallinifaecis TaxID=215590 RepID=A0A502BME5_9HYPH|nr:PAS domain-containing protein [Brucella gallinifaecis]TPF75652.1 PAS domain-containing protein [Brucella gallinifaecis]